MMNKFEEGHFGDLVTDRFDALNGFLDNLAAERFGVEFQDKEMEQQIIEAAKKVVAQVVETETICGADFFDFCLLMNEAGARREDDLRELDTALIGMLDEAFYPTEEETEKEIERLEREGEFDLD